MKIHEYPNKIFSITYYRMKGFCLSFNMRPSSMVYDKKQLRYFQFSMCTPIIEIQNGIFSVFIFDIA